MIDGVSRCARYSFGPNRLHLCGPDANREVLAYLAARESDQGLENLLHKFKTLYPYLALIAHANGIADPFDERVVESYWLGNELFSPVTPQMLLTHFTDKLKLKKRLTARNFSHLTATLQYHPLPHHNFHVFNVWQRTGHAETEHTLESMDKCRVSWGRVTLIDGPFITVSRQPLIRSHCHPALDAGSRQKKQNWNSSRLILSSPVPYRITRRLDDDSLMEEVKLGDTISIHWDMPCEILTSTQLRNLKHYTRLSLSYSL